MKSQVARCVEQVGRSVIVYDDTQVSHMREELFDASFWSERSEVASGGRGQTLFVRHDDSDWVLRHYFRGGLIVDCWVKRGMGPPGELVGRALGRVTNSVGCYSHKRIGTCCELNGSTAKNS